MSQNNKLSQKAKIGILLFLMVAFFSIVLLWSTIKVMWVEGDMWRERANEMSKNYIDQKAQRGNIYSSDGKILATTVPECELYFDFRRVPALDKNGKVRFLPNGVDTLFETAIADSNYIKYLDTVCTILHNAFPDSSVAAFRKIINDKRTEKKPKGCVRIKRHVPYSDWNRICKLPGWGRGVVKYVDGRSVIYNKRFHTYGNLAESVIGFRTSYYNEEYNGLEGYYDSILRGRDGRVLCRRLTRGSWIAVSRNPNLAIPVTDSILTDSVPGYPVINGQHIISTIDSRLQDIAHYSLEQALQRYGSSAGCAILIEAATGNVLVCSSLIRDSLGNYFESPYRNVAVTDLYEPGSIFKPVLLTAMYNNPDITLDTAMPLPVGRKKFSANSKIVEDHGIANSFFPLWKAVAVSSNVAFCELAWRFYNNQRDSLFAHVSRIFPFDRINPDIIVNEYKCRTHPLTYDNDFLRFCYGYTSSVSPLRMATFYNALANKGCMVKPRFCKAIIRNGEVVELETQTINDHICSKETAETLRDLLVGVVEGGTGDNIRNDTYSIAGKTGTAVTKPNSPVSNATFVGFFPADNPKYTCLVMMQDIRSFGRNAAPVFQDIADCVVSLDKTLDCRPTMKKMKEKANNGDVTVYDPPFVSKAPQAEVRKALKRLGLPYNEVTKKSTWCTYSEPDHPYNVPARYNPYTVPSDIVPNCYGMTVKDALLLCRQLGLDVSFDGYGKVVSQDPKARTPLANTSSIHLTLKP